MKLQTARTAALALPDAVEAPHHDHASFRVRGRIFATVPPGGEVVHVFVAEPDRERALALHPGFAAALRWGGKVVGLRVTLAEADPVAVKTLLRQAHAHAAARPAVRPRRPR